MKTRIALTILIALAVYGAIFGLRLRSINKTKAAMAARPAPVVTVTADTVEQARWRTTLAAVASLESYRGIVLKTEIEGRVEKVAFESGAVVKAGDLLVELEASAEKAQLRSLEARAKLTALTLHREADLRAKGTNSQADLDEAEAGAAESEAAIEEIKVTLAKKRIVAPFDGRLGIRQVSLGQFLAKGDELVQLEALDPIYADFGLPQQEIARVTPGLEVRLIVDAFHDQSFSGKIEAVNPRVADATRNIRIRATVPNAEEKLRPGMFGRVEVLLPDESDVLVLPATAIVYSPYGDMVYLVKEEKAADGSVKLTAAQQFVQVGGRRGDQVSILKGLKPGDRVVSSGQNKLRNGVLVKIDNSVVPTNNPAPKPTES